MSIRSPSWTVWEKSDDQRSESQTQPVSAASAVGSAHSKGDSRRPPSTRHVAVTRSSAMALQPQLVESKPPASAASAATLRPAARLSARPRRSSGVFAVSRPYTCPVEFDLTDEQRLIQDTVRSFVDERVLPNAIENDIEHRLDMSVIEGMAKLGLLGIVIPEEYGGSGLDFVAEALACEEIERGEAAFRT